VLELAALTQINTPYQVKNIQIIDGARNSVFEIYSVSDEVFFRLFPDGADISFMEDFPEEDPVWIGFYQKPVRKMDVIGIHGTLHFHDKSIKSPYFPTRREIDVRSYKATP
jgi:hypothetical protein